MAVRDIPPSREWVCDVCAKAATGPLQPDGWARVQLRTTERQVDKLVCDDHVAAVDAALVPAA